MKFVIKGEPFGKLNMQPINMGGHARAFNPKSNVEYMDRVINAIDNAEEFIHFEKDEEVLITIIAYFKIPKQHFHFYKKLGTTDLDTTGKKMLSGEIKPTKKPDLDNISKVICDGITKHGDVWYDDSQVCTSLLIKRYDLVPRVEVVLERRAKK